MGTARFLVYLTVMITLWLGWNSLAPRDWRFDPYTFTLLTLLLSIQASYAAPLILLAQNRQADRDRVALEEDRRRAAMQKADTEYLAREIAALRIALGDVATRDFLRSELNRLGEHLGDRASRAVQPGADLADADGGPTHRPVKKRQRSDDLAGQTPAETRKSGRRAGS
jgi:uncharacterized membrane protein